MLTIFITAVNAIMPIVLLIALGYVLRQRNFLTAEFVRVGNKFMFQLLLPLMLFTNTYSIPSFSSVPWDLTLYALGAIGCIFILGELLTPPLTKVPGRKGVLLQSTFRSNTAVIGIPLAQALGGEEAVQVATIMTALCVPLLNALAVVSLSLYGNGGGKPDRKKLLKTVAKNPLILGISAGFLCIALRTLQQRLFGRVVFTLSGDLKFLYSALRQAGSIATPFALIVLGSQFNFSAIGNMKREILWGTLWRVAIAPVLGLGSAILLTSVGLLHCVSPDYPALIALFGTPAAVSSAVMAGQMGCDEMLATQIVVWSSIASIFTLFLTVCLLMGTGLLTV